MCNIVFIVVVMKKRKVVSVSLQFKMCSTADAEHISVISISNRCSAMSCNIYVGQMPTRYGIMLKNSRVRGEGAETAPSCCQYSSGFRDRRFANR